MPDFLCQMFEKNGSHSHSAGGSNLSVNCRKAYKPENGNCSTRLIPAGDDIELDFGEFCDNTDTVTCIFNRQSDSVGEFISNFCAFWNSHSTPVLPPVWLPIWPPVLPPVLPPVWLPIWPPVLATCFATCMATCLQPLLPCLIVINAFCLHDFYLCIV